MAGQYLVVWGHLIRYTGVYERMQPRGFLDPLTAEGPG